MLELLKLASYTQEQTLPTFLIINNFLKIIINANNFSYFLFVFFFIYQIINKINLFILLLFKELLLFKILIFLIKIFIKKMATLSLIFKFFYQFIN